MERDGLSLTNNHGGELEALLNRLAVYLIWQVCKTNIALQLLANHIADGLVKFK